jgi:hypothetical protein
MRAFLAACAATLAIALGAMIILDALVQEPVSTAFATSAARISPGTPSPR